MLARKIAAGLAILAAAAGVGACGSSTKPASTSTSTTGHTASTPAHTGGLAPAVSELPAAEHPTAAQFPPVAGRTLQQLGALVHGSVQFGAATGTFTPGHRRLAFALNASSGAFVYAPTAVYIASSPSAHDVQGPFLAPADPMAVAPQYRSRQNEGPGGIQAIYAAQLPLAHPGTVTVLALTHTARGLIGAPGEIAVAASSPIPDVGQRAPSIATDTPASVHGDMALLTTRIPPDDMHSVSLNQVLGKRPVALLFSTPQLCTSRVCGPVTDIAVSLEHEFAGRIAFIHEEVYVDNQPSKGLRPQMKAFHLQTEPWLFAIDRHGVIVARLEGAFGVNELRQALEAAMR
ncbi:MAG TPA: hypothetical protein VE992_03325 [Solirubrobacteraceae bacterium]|nr:hypothetical protein [Solirubrobacteraceae bacterium]